MIEGLAGTEYFTVQFHTAMSATIRRHVDDIDAFFQSLTPHRRPSGYPRFAHATDSRQISGVRPLSPLPSAADMRYNTDDMLQRLYYIDIGKVL